MKVKLIKSESSNIGRSDKPPVSINNSYANFSKTKKSINNNTSKKKARMQLITYNPLTKNLTTENSKTIQNPPANITIEDINNDNKPIDTDVSPNYANLMNDISVTSKNSFNDIINHPELPNDDEDDTFNDFKQKYSSIKKTDLVLNKRANEAFESMKDEIAIESLGRGHNFNMYNHSRNNIYSNDYELSHRLINDENIIINCITDDNSLKLINKIKDDLRFKIFDGNRFLALNDNGTFNILSYLYPYYDSIAIHNKLFRKKVLLMLKNKLKSSIELFKTTYKDYINLSSYYFKSKLIKRNKKECIY
jgi:hypothetical protein